MVNLSICKSVAATIIQQVNNYNFRS